MAGQRVTVKASIFVVDDETFLGDERKHEIVFGDAIIGDEDVPIPLLSSRVGVGGEVRAELELFVRRETGNSVHIDGITRLFEGTSEDTQDLEASKIISLTVPLTNTVDHSVKLRNPEADGGDIALYDLQFRNLPAGVVLTSGGGLYGSLPKQDQWRYCIRCGGLWFAGGSTSGRCPAGGGHTQNGSGNYMLVDSVNFAHGQPNWRFCHRCCGLWFGGAGHTGRCPAGNGHSATGSGNYVLTESTRVTGQRDWRWCERCLGLWFHGRMGRCPRGGGHSLIGSGDYVLTGNL